MGKDKYADKAEKRTPPSAPSSYEAKAIVEQAAPPEEKTEKAEKPKGEVKGRAHIVAYLASAKARHSNLPQSLLEEMGEAPSKGQAQRLLRDYLRKTQIIQPAEV